MSLMVDRSIFFAAKTSSRWLENQSAIPHRLLDRASTLTGPNYMSFSMLLSWFRCRFQQVWHCSLAWSEAPSVSPQPTKAYFAWITPTFTYHFSLVDQIPLVFFDLLHLFTTSPQRWNVRSAIRMTQPFPSPFSWLGPASISWLLSHINCLDFGLALFNNCNWCSSTLAGDHFFKRLEHLFAHAVGSTIPSVEVAILYREIAHKFATFCLQNVFVRLHGFNVVQFTELNFCQLLSNGF